MYYRRKQDYEKIVFYGILIREKLIIMERLNLNHLYYFYVTAMEGSIKSASERLHVTQPTISDQIKLLEEFFDQKLFHRVSRSLVLTDKGEIALQYAEEIFQKSLELTQVLKLDSSVPRNTIEIGITDYMSQYFLYDLIMPMLKDSEIAVNFKEEERQYLIADLDRGERDIVLTYSKDSLPNSINAYRIGVNRTYVVAHKKFKNRKRKEKEKFPYSLKNIPFMNYTKDSFLRYEIDHYFAKLEIAPPVLGECDDIDLLELVVREGVGFVIVPETAKNRLCLLDNIVSLGELKEFQTTVWALIRHDSQSIAKDFVLKLEK